MTRYTHTTGINRDGSPSKHMLKGQQTRAAILEAALGVAAQMGLEGLSIGLLADVCKMSKSGVFAHFGSREELQISVIKEYHARFEEEVFLPATKAPRGLPRLKALFDRWVKRVTDEVDSGCIYISGAVEFDDRSGTVRDALAEMVLTWHAALNKAIKMAIDEGHMVEGIDVDQIKYELHGMILSLHHDARFLRHAGTQARAYKAFERLLKEFGTEAGIAAAGLSIVNKNQADLSLSADQT